MDKNNQNATIQWVEPQWVRERLGSGQLAIIDVQPDVHDYILEHIPGSIYMNEKLWRCSDKGLPAQYVPAESIEPIIRRLGIDSTIPVVIYSGRGRFSKGGDGLEQTMAAYSFARFGHSKVYIMDGGLAGWRQERFPITKEYPSVSSRDYICSIQEDFYIEYDEFVRIKDCDDVQVFDVRPESVYEGKAIWSKGGHIPGAVSMPWRDFMRHHNPYYIKMADEISELVQRRGADRNKTTIVYCGTGREATNAFIVFKWILGFSDVKLYEGSFTEWSSYPENPTVLGTSPE